MLKPFDNFIIAYSLIIINFQVGQFYLFIFMYFEWFGARTVFILETKGIV